MSVYTAFGIRLTFGTNLNNGLWQKWLRLHHKIAMHFHFFSWNTYYYNRIEVLWCEEA